MSAVRRHRQGLTLIEMLAVIALTGIIIGMGVHVGNLANRIGRRQHARLAASRAGWQWTHQISRELRMALPPAGLGRDAEFAGQHVTRTFLEALGGQDWSENALAVLKATRLDDDVIRFPVARVLDKGDNEVPGVVEYRLHRDENGHVMGIMRRSRPLGTRLEQGEVQVSTPEAIALGFMYLGADGSWASEWPEPTVLPRAVRITIGTYVPRRNRPPRLMQFSTVVHLPVGRRISP